KVANSVEYFSLTRSDQAIRHSDLALLFLDVTQLPARLDQELGRTIQDRHKPVVVVGTKSDLRPDFSVQDFRDWISRKLPHLKNAPLRLLSNEGGRGHDAVMKSAFALREEAGRRVGTGELNRALQKTFTKLRFRGRGEKPQAFYATQLRVHPPSFLLFVNHKRLFEKEVVRAVTRDLAKQLGYEHVPVRMVLRERKRSPSKRS
ncbi:MAG: hypothetical protein MK213_07550, partial [Planctomycetes bacterium]|nr:hypothetical protein [Planctomycetota bacterium]